MVLEALLSQSPVSPSTKAKILSIHRISPLTAFNFSNRLVFLSSTVEKALGERVPWERMKGTVILARPRTPEWKNARNACLAAKQGTFPTGRHGVRLLDIAALESAIQWMESLQVPVVRPMFDLSEQELQRQIVLLASHTSIPLRQEVPLVDGRSHRRPDLFAPHGLPSRPNVPTYFELKIHRIELNHVQEKIVDARYLELMRGVHGDGFRLVFMSPRGISDEAWGFLMRHKNATFRPLDAFVSEIWDEVRRMYLPNASSYLVNNLKSMYSPILSFTGA